MSRHTPGPWESIWDHPTSEAQGNELGEEWGIRAQDGTIVVGTFYYDGLHLEMKREDAALIVESPAMFELLESIVDDGDKGRFDHDVWRGVARRLVERVRKEEA